MAMLAEPRRRNKWSLNPRGSTWANDNTKIGQKLLEMMGWSKGKGLGRDEQGAVEPVRLNYKCDTKGMGFKGHDDGWLAHKDEFDGILSQLNGEDPLPQEEEAISAKSLEIRSKTSRARVHYHKFTRGKDISRYSSEDLACILGKRASTKNDSVQDKPSEEEETNDTAVVDEVDHSHGITTIRKGNINDYFASKMAALRQKSAPVEAAEFETVNQLDRTETETEVTMDGEEESGAKRVRFNEALNVVNEFSAKMRILAETPEDKGKKKKKEKKIEAETAPPVETDKKVKKQKKEQVKETCVDEEVNETEVKAKKSKRKSSELSDEPKSKKMKKDSSVEGTSIDAPEAVRVDEGAEVEEDGKQKKKKKKKKKSKSKEVEEGVGATEAEAEAAGSEGETTEKVTKKKKKKKDKEKNKCGGIGEEVAAEEDVNGSVFETRATDEDGSVQSDKDKKRKKKNDKGKVAEVSAVLADVAEGEAKKKTKKKKKEADEMGSMECVDTEEPLAPEDGDTADAKKQSQDKEKKKKKRSKSEDADEAATKAKESREETETVATEDNDSDGVDKKEKEKKKKSSKRKKVDALESGADVDEAQDPPSKVGKTDGDVEVTGLKKTDFSYLGSAVRPDTLKKIESKFMSSNFDLFVGSNLHTITGYGCV